MRSGDLLLEVGDVLNPGAIAVAAAIGRSRVRVARPARVAILSTGDELLPPEEYHRVISGSGVPETNSRMIAAALTLFGAEPVLLGIANDDPEDITRALHRASGSDLLITTGGASMGEADLLKRVLDRLGFEQEFWRVRMRPGSPLSFGHVRLPSRETRGEVQALPVFGLPGNPTSSFVTFELFVRPFVLRLMGHKRVHRTVIECEAGETLRGARDLSVFLRVVLHSSRSPGGYRVSLTGPQGSGLVRGLGIAEGLAVLPEGIEEIHEGGSVKVLLLHDAGLRTASGW